MSYSIDKKDEFLNTIKFKSDSGVEYQLFYSETNPGSKLWTFSFSLISGIPSDREVFRTISTVQKLMLEQGGIVDKNNIDEVIITIDGKNKEEIEKKTKAFTRWITKPFDYEVFENPVINIEGKIENIYLQTNMIHIKRTKFEEKKETKFCFNCGSINKENYKFCPNCGQSLQQA